MRVTVTSGSRTIMPVGVGTEKNWIAVSKLLSGIRGMPDDRSGRDLRYEGTLSPGGR